MSEAIESLVSKLHEVPWNEYEIEVARTYLLDHRGARHPLPSDVKTEIALLVIKDCLEPDLDMHEIALAVAVVLDFLERHGPWAYPDRYNLLTALVGRKRYNRLGLFRLILATDVLIQDLERLCPSSSPPAAESRRQ